MQSSLRNMVLVLVTITLVASAAVGGVYMLTKEPIEKAQIDKTNAAIAQVLPAFDNDPSSEAMEKTVDGEKIKIYPATKQGQNIGYAVQTFSQNGFGGKISLLVGFSPEGKIIKIAVLEHKETPGLGDKIEPAKSDFALQFEGADPTTMKIAVKKDGGDVDAITASTISSRAYADAVERAYQIFTQINNAQ